MATDKVLSLSLVFATCGSLIVMMLGDRFGLVLPLVVAVLLLLVSLVLLGGMDSLSTYAVATCKGTSVTSEREGDGDPLLTSLGIYLGRCWQLGLTSI